MANKTVTVRPSGGTYTSLQAAITGEVTANADLTAAGMDGILNIEISGTWSSADTTRADVAGFTVDENHYVNIYTDTANRASKRDATKYRLIVAGDWGAPALQVSNAYTRVRGIQVSATGGFNTGINCANVAGIILDSVLCYDCPGGADNYPGIRLDGTGTALVNCISMGHGNDGIRVAGGSSYIYNCDTVGNGAVGIFVVAWITATITNCYSGGNTGDDYLAQEFATADFTGSYSEDGTMTTSVVAYTTGNFTNVTGGSEDLTLKMPTSHLMNAGTDLSENIQYPYTWDILGNERNGDEGHWSAGAFEPPYYSLTFNGNGGSLEDDSYPEYATPVSSITYEGYREGDSAGVQFDVYTVETGWGYIREGYLLVGWNTEAGGGGTHYDNTVETSVPFGASSVTLYAEWESEGPPTYYSVTYNGNGNTGGSVPVDSSSYEAGASVTVLSGASLSRPYYDFSEWNTVPVGSGTSYAPSATFTMPTSDEILYARWTPHVYQPGDTLSMPTGGITMYPTWSGVAETQAVDLIYDFPSTLGDRWTETDPGSLITYPAAVGPASAVGATVSLAEQPDRTFLTHSTIAEGGPGRLDKISGFFWVKTLNMAPLEWGQGYHFIEFWDDESGGIELASIMCVKDAPDGLVCIRARVYPADNNLYRSDFALPSNTMLGCAWILDRATHVLKITMYNTDMVQQGSEIVTGATIADSPVSELRILGWGPVNNLAGQSGAMSKFIVDYTGAEYPIDPRIAVIRS